MKWQEWRDLAKNEVFWRNREEKGLVKVEYMRDYILQLHFEEDSGVSIYDLDFYSLLVEENPGGVFKVLKDKKRFRQAEGDYALIWPNPETRVYDEKAIDIAPECVRYFCEKYGKKITETDDVMQIV